MRDGAYDCLNALLLCCTSHTVHLATNTASALNAIVQLCVPQLELPLLVNTVHCMCHKGEQSPLCAQGMSSIYQQHVSKHFQSLDIGFLHTHTCFPLTQLHAMYKEWLFTTLHITVAFFPVAVASVQHTRACKVHQLLPSQTTAGTATYASCCIPIPSPSMRL